MPAIVQAAHSSLLNRLSSFRLLLRDCSKFGEHTFKSTSSYFARQHIRSISRDSVFRTHEVVGRTGSKDFHTGRLAREVRKGSHKLMCVRESARSPMKII